MPSVNESSILHMALCVRVSVLGQKEVGYAHEDDHGGRA
jgi:hypothetical protein